jgi:hypothetical protein
MGGSKSGKSNWRPLEQGWRLPPLRAVLLRGKLPELINEDEKLVESSFGVPTECLDEVAATVRAAGLA